MTLKEALMVKATLELMGDKLSDCPWWTGEDSKQYHEAKDIIRRECRLQTQEPECDGDDIYIVNGWE